MPNEPSFAGELKRRVGMILGYEQINNGTTIEEEEEDPRLEKKTTKRDTPCDDAADILSSSSSSPSSPSSSGGPSHRSLTWSSICFITYFNVCGGPWGTEEVISSVGPCPGLLGLVLMAATFGVPLALVTSELSSAYPVNGGYSIWVSEAFGTFWGLQESYWSWVSGVVDNALYPLLTYRAICLGFGYNPDKSYYFAGFVFRVAIALVYSAPGLFLLRPIGDGLAIFFIIIMVPFLILTVYAPASNPVELSTLFHSEEDASWGGGWRDLLTVLYWNFSGIDSASTSAGEVIRPGYHYPRGLLACVFIILITYMVPLLAVTIVNKPPYESWEDGSFASIARAQGGRWLADLVAIAGIIGNAGMHIAEMFEDAWQLHGMAEVNLVPRIFRYRHPYFQTPWACITIQIVIISLLQAFDFQVIVCIDNFFSVIGVLLELLAFVYLRYSKPDMARPFKIPLSNTMLTAVLAPVFSLGVIVVVASLTGSLVSLCINIGGLLIGVLGTLVAMYRYEDLRYTPKDGHSELIR